MGETESAALINGSRMGVLKWPHSAGEHTACSLHVVFCFYFLSSSLNRKRHPRLLASLSLSSHRWLRPPVANWFYCSYPPPPGLIFCHFWNTNLKSSRLGRNTTERRTLQYKHIPQSIRLAGSGRIKLGSWSFRPNTEFEDGTKRVTLSALSLSKKLLAWIIYHENNLMICCIGTLANISLHWIVFILFLFF